MSFRVLRHAPSRVIKICYEFECEENTYSESFMQIIDHKRVCNLEKLKFSHAFAHGAFINCRSFNPSFGFVLSGQ